jgi:hypothetical protein
MPNRPLNLVEQGNLLNSIRRDIARIKIALERLMAERGLPAVTDEEVDAALADEPDLDTRTGIAHLNLHSVPSPEDEDEGEDESKGRD